MPSPHRYALPPTRCAAHLKGDKAKQCRRYAVPGLATCAYHGGKNPDAQDKATQVNALATLLSGDPRPLHEALLDHINTLDAVARDAKTQALSTLNGAGGDGSGSGALDPDTLTRMLDTARLATVVINASQRTGLLERAVTAQEHRVQVETRLVARVVEATVTPLLDWFERAGLASPGRLREMELDAADPETRREIRRRTELYYEARSELVALKTWLGQNFAATVRRFNGSDSEHPEQTPPSFLDDYILVRRSDFEAMRETVRRYRPALDSKPADIAPPPDFVHVPPANGHRTGHVPTPPYYAER